MRYRIKESAEAVKFEVLDNGTVFLDGENNAYIKVRHDLSVNAVCLTYGTVTCFDDDILVTPKPDAMLEIN